MTRISVIAIIVYFFYPFSQRSTIELLNASNTHKAFHSPFFRNLKFNKKKKSNSTTYTKTKYIRSTQTATYTHKHILTLKSISDVVIQICSPFELTFRHTNTNTHSFHSSIFFPITKCKTQSYVK